ncbi:AraC family transcriptional regulator [Pseudomonas sp. HR96]|uniref:AraC family transcriptional regulator n=1 Tax=Pseudomonas sp. HR96 TaxID=1027966 RepID=UPI002A74DFB2|nr:AraC family transcriptional regulator [Pseudomonas sp. HR96]WPO97958.1 AraC family transcriptional regulator [Pseudomonas sp. HR96]
MTRRPAPTCPACSPSVRRAEVGPWLIELLPAMAYHARYVAPEASVGFAFDSQRGQHAIGSDRVLPFTASANGLAFVPAGCDVFSESAEGGEYLRLVRLERQDAAPWLQSDAFNNRLDRQAMTLARRLRIALLSPSPLDDCEGWALALAGCTVAARGAPPSGPGAGLTTRRLRLLDDWLQAHLEQPLSVQAMAALLGLSEAYFSRAFKQSTGQSPHSYLLDRRIARARSLLLGSSSGLADIAQRCGFASHAHLSLAFRQRLGLTPSQLRGRA